MENWFLVCQYKKCVSVPPWSILRFRSRVASSEATSETENRLFLYKYCSCCLGNICWSSWSPLVSVASVATPRRKRLATRDAGSRSLPPRPNNRPFFWVMTPPDHNIYINLPESNISWLPNASRSKITHIDRQNGP